MSSETEFHQSSDPPDFPQTFWNETRAAFLPEGVAPSSDAQRTAALVFAVQGERFLLAHIGGRGWCIPGGRIEAEEAPEQAVRREAREETGATLGPLTRLGHFVLTDTVSGGQQEVPTYVAEVVKLDTLPPHTESQGIAWMSLKELPERYYMWDALLEAVFRYALRIRSEEAKAVQPTLFPANAGRESGKGKKKS